MIKLYEQGGRMKTIVPTLDIQCNFVYKHTNNNYET